MVTKQHIISAIVVLFHLVGLWGFLSPELTPLFIELVPLHLLSMLLLLVISGYDRSAGILMFACIVYSAGFLIEVAGVNSGLIFGRYSYGSTLGIKLWETPLLIGVNWLLLVYCTGILLGKYKLNRFIFALTGAAILVMIDILIEPVAVKYDYWQWLDGPIPFQNYSGWFLVSFCLFLVFFSIEFKKQNSAAVVLLISQVCFFMGLNVWGT
ncbi:MAG: carotenoid biosynthesis protein [Daejeonella sp.]